jgi:hypothetical protein
MRSGVHNRAGPMHSAMEFYFLHVTHSDRSAATAALPIR